MCLLAIYVSSLEKFSFFYWFLLLLFLLLFCFVVLFFVVFIVVLLLNCVSCFYILEIKPLLVVPFSNIFSQSIGCPFVMFMVTFAVQKLIKFG